nr:MAG: Pentaxin family protein [Bacteriophage sp.]
MGTISDKLMRIINTKEDIRQALISKGYDVPTSIPFKEYAKMILDLPCKVDSFPDIEGIVARYSASGLTNEQMAANPVWVDKTGNDHDLQMKNFAWGGMSGVNGYVQNFNYFRNNATVDKVRIDEQSSNSIKVTLLTSGMGHVIYIPKDVYQFNKSYFIKISSEGYNEGDLFLSFYAPSTSTATTVKVPLNPNGITEIPAIKEDDFLAVYLFNAAGKVGSITIEQLPLYPGALVFDGVDDYGVCDNFPILTKEKGYTVVVLRQWDQDFLNTTLTGGLLSTRNYSTGEGVAFEKIESSNKGYRNLGAGGIIDFAKSPFTWQTSKQYNNVGILKGDKNHGKPLCVGCGLSGGQQCGRFAIRELVFLDHDATEEELTKIKDYFVKTYPWLFPDQAWTVVGKTNEDEDRATIANITGNGNDLVLSNFGFAEGSGYNEEGEYAGYLVTDGVDDKIISSIFKMGNDWTVIGDWELINTGKNDNAGIVKFDSIVIYNYNYNYNSMLINIKNGRNILIPDQNTVNAICSDGRIYSKDWKESIYNEETESTSKNFLTIGYSGNAYTKIAFKNLAIYPTVLSREDCIKAYNYLQTLKAK